MNLVMNPEYTFKIASYNYCMSDWEDKPLKHLDVIEWRNNEFLVLGWDSSETKFVEEEEKYENLYFLLIRNDIQRIVDYRDKLIEYANDKEKTQELIKEIETKNETHYFSHISSNEVKNTKLLSNRKILSNLSFSDLML